METILKTTAFLGFSGIGLLVFAAVITRPVSPTEMDKSLHEYENYLTVVRIAADDLNINLDGVGGVVGLMSYDGFSSPLTGVQSAIRNHLCDKYDSCYEDTITDAELQRIRALADTE